MVDLVVCVAVLTFILFVLTSNFLRRRSTKASTCLPSAALLSCPLFGHLSMLGRYPHRAMTLLSRRLGPIYSIRLGRRQAVVVNGRAAVRAAFSTAVPAGRQLDDRPDFELYRHYAGGCSISFGRRGRALRLHRRLARGIIRRLITSGLAEEIIEREAATLVAAWTDDRHQHDDRRLDPADGLTMAVSSAIYSMCYGLDASIADDPEYRQLLKTKNTNGDVFAIAKQGDLVPGCLRRFIVDSRQVAAVTRQMETHVRLNAARVQQRSAATSTTDVDETHGDVLDAVLATASSPTTVDRMCSAGLTHAHLTSMPLEFLSAGSETSSATLIWILRFMVMHPEVQRQVHAELDRELVAGRPVTYSDRKRLPYVEAVILEAMRLAPVVPLALPHFTAVDVDMSSPATTTESCELTIPAGSIVIANLWSVGRDPDVWHDVEVFRPERFLREVDTAVTQPANVSSERICSCPLAENPHKSDSAEGVEDAVEGRSLVVDDKLIESFYPFSFGARRCVGESLGRLQIFVFFATIMRSCRLLQADGKPPPSDGETYGDVIRPAPYEIHVLPR